MKPLNKILYVDDEIDLQKIVKIALHDIGGMKVECCGSGMSALKLMKTFHPDLVLLDVMMPELDGIQTLTKIRHLKFESYVPVIFMTAQTQDSEIENYKKLDILDVVIKPFDPITLASKLLDIWNHHAK